MWSFHRKELTPVHGVHFQLTRDDRTATYVDVLTAWQDDASFRTFFNTLLAESPYSAFRWETPPVTTTSLSRPFEFVLLDSPTLNRRPDQRAFSGHFKSARSSVIVFPNISGDAQMVVPCPVADVSVYGHLAAFVRGAPAAQRDALWQAVGATLGQRIGDRPVWLSTAGAGVAWLHVRLDERPKYYGYAAYVQ